MSCFSFGHPSMRGKFSCFSRGWPYSKKQGHWICRDLSGLGREEVPGNGVL
jgi:hypothetical protein